MTAFYGESCGWNPAQSYFFGQGLTRAAAQSGYHGLNLLWFLSFTKVFKTVDPGAFASLEPASKPTIEG
jgi:hypothetical protein